MEFQKFNKIPRLSRDMTITEKIDGTNGLIAFDDNLVMAVGSRSRWLSLDSDNHGFCHWAKAYEEELRQLGPGLHYGEWWGQGIQRRYGLKEKRFSLFNVGRWNKDNIPPCCHVVPILYEGPFDTVRIDLEAGRLALRGSQAAPGFMDPEGIIIFHHAANSMFKKTIKNDSQPKTLVVER